jgi:tetratricopeptide (TPR) repeat protein
MHTETQPAAELRLSDASPAQRSVMTALALGATYRSPTWISSMLGLLGEPTGGKRLTNERLGEVLQELKKAGRITEYPKRGAWKLSPVTDNAVLLSLLERPDFGAFAGLLAKQDRVDQPFSRFGSQEDAAALVRLELLAGRPPAEVQARWQQAFPFGHAQEVLRMALGSLHQAALIRHLHPAVQIQLVRQGLVHQLTAWEPATQPLAELATGLLGTAVAADDVGLRLLLIEYRLCCGHLDDIEALLPPLREAGGEHAARYQAFAQSAEAAVLASQGHWAEAQARYEAALAVLRKPPGTRKGALPAYLMQPYLQCLLAQQTPECLDKALKLCVTEAGQRQPPKASIERTVCTRYSHAIPFVALTGP